MGKLRVLSAEEAVRLPEIWPDFYFSPAYGFAVEESDNAVWEVAMWEPGPIVYPYLKRPLPAGYGSGDGCFDITSPYGYSGSWAPLDVSMQEWKDFRCEIRRHLLKRGCVAEFQRLSGLVSGRQQLLEADPQLRGRHHNNTIAIDLSQGYQACWAAAEGRCRTKTRKALRLGYQWSSHNAAPEDVGPESDFRLLYESTLKRVGASDYFFFPDAYYQKLCQHLSQRLFVLRVRAPDGAVAAAGLFVDWAPQVHLHLVGSRLQGLKDGVGNLIYHGLIRWGCEQGRFELLHIGGGIVPDDKLFYFKKGFGGRPVPFWVATSVIEPDCYRNLVAAHAKRSGQTAEDLLNGAYFPAYRS